jgi:hypothetical protein
MVPPMARYRLFISAVSSEFERARDQLAASLRGREMDIAVQSDFRQHDGRGRLEVQDTLGRAAIHEGRRIGRRQDMDLAQGASVLSLCPDVPRHRWTMDDYHRMGEVGLLDPDDRVELIEGEIVEMAPIGDAHADASNRLNRLLVLAIGETGFGDCSRVAERHRPRPSAPRRGDP